MNLWQLVILNTVTALIWNPETKILNFANL